ncbi:hypothetical protein Tco_0434485 [Tanacetum coccineum]
MECLVTRFIVMILREFGVNPLRIKVESVYILEIDGMWSRYGGGSVVFCGYGGGGDMVVCHGSKGCLDHWILRSSPLLLFSKVVYGLLSAIVVRIVPNKITHPVDVPILSSDESDETEIQELKYESLNEFNIVILWNAEERVVVPPGYSFEYSCTGLRTAPTSEVDFLKLAYMDSLDDFAKKYKYTSIYDSSTVYDEVNKYLNSMKKFHNDGIGERVMNKVKANNRKEQKIGGFDSEMEHHNVINIMRLLQDDDMEEIQVANMVGLQTVRELEDEFVKKFCMTILKLQEIVNNYDQKKKKKKKQLF